ncbi:MAG: acyl-CoA dehydratase activase [Archaeoglobaceae archaeon]|nr:acyl-CoA dehydratase activase [Archaeoglobaceae archaeon]MDW8128283.1 acyl-CoA dehydratase activase [Archaeoglobaceae archaeon]
MISAGIDIGSITAKCVILQDHKILAYRILKVKPDLEESAKEIFEETLKLSGLKREEIDRIVATGYGRARVDFADKKITEITCHAIGATFLIPEARTVIDIGGQDSKVIAVENGKVLDFVMNDKCAAGTGRFIEVMANALGLKIEQVGELALKAKEKLKISSTCTVFAESEVVSYISAGRKVEEIIAGVCDAIAGRLMAMVARVGVRREVVLTGGVAKNMGVRRAIEEKLGFQVIVPEEPQIVGALGAAVLGTK